MAPEIGQLIGAYELIATLGSGGMGDVYRARDTRLGRLVAIKFVARELAGNAIAEARFHREARLASSLNHPGIVTVFDVGEYDGRPFVVMELIDGHPLSSELSDGRLRTREAVELATQIADALAAAHDAGIVHRDLKPQNIMLAAGRRVKIVDFGLSKMTAMPDGATATLPGDGITGDHAVIGTVGYMAPEQVMSRQADGRSDQFALGAILYEMLSGRRAFQRDTPFQTMSSIVEDDPLDLSQIRSDLPPQLVAITGRCLAKHPEDRYASTRDLARDLREVGEQIVADTRPLPSGTRPALRRRRWPLVAAAALISAALLGAALWTRGGTQTIQDSLSHQKMRYIAVLPFANITRDTSDEVFADGLTETLASSLTQLERFQRSLRVVPASEVRSGRVTSVKEARDMFGVTLAISGSIQRLPSMMRLTLNLVDAERVAQIGSRTIDIATGREVITQDTVISAATALLALELEPKAHDALVAGGTSATGAYGLYVQGRGYLQRFDRGADNIDRAIDALSRAVAIDPRYALAHTALGEAYWRRYDATRDATWIDQAVAHCETALGIDSRLAPVHVTLAMIARSRGRYEEAVAVAQRAVELDPVSSDAYRELGRAQEALQRTADAESTYRKMIAARPDDWQAFQTLGAFFLARNRLDEAADAFQRVIALTPDNTRGYNNLGVTYFRLQRHADAAQAWERSISIRPTLAATSNLGTYYFGQGRWTDAARSFEAASKLTPNDWRIWRNFGAALWQVPDRDRATSAFAKAVELGEAERRINPRQASLLAGLADAHSMIGNRSEALQAAAAAERLGPDADDSFTLACVFEQLGDRAAALKWLERSLASGYALDAVERSPSMASLRKDSRYQTLTRNPPTR